MAIKIDTNQSAVAYHIVDGAVIFPYPIDAHHAVSNFPLEWSEAPWSAEDMAAARKEAGQPVIEPTPEEQAAIDEHAKAVAEANARLEAFRKKQAEEQAIADQVAADEALVASPPPRPDPNARRRPFGRPGEPTPAELEQIKKREKAAADKKAADDKLAQDKADADKIAAASAQTAKP
jgi:hypothetical protein